MHALSRISSLFFNFVCHWPVKIKFFECYLPSPPIHQCLLHHDNPIYKNKTLISRWGRFIKFEKFENWPIILNIKMYTILKPIKKKILIFMEHPTCQNTHYTSLVIVMFLLIVNYSFYFSLLSNI